MHTNELAHQQQTRQWSALLAAAVTATPQQVLALAQPYSQAYPLLASSAYTALCAQACEIHRHLRGHPCRPGPADLLAHVEALGEQVSDPDKIAAGLFAREYFSLNASSGQGEDINKYVYRLMVIYQGMTAAQRAAAIAVAAGYAAQHAALMPPLFRHALQLLYTHAPTPDDPFAPVFAALLAADVAQGVPARTTEAIKQCGGPVFQNTVWVCLRTAASFAVPGAPVTVPHPAGCDCADGGEAAAILGPWATDIGAGRADMRAFLHTQLSQYLARDTPVAEHMLSCAVELLTTLATPKTP